VSFAPGTNLLIEECIENFGKNIVDDCCSSSLETDSDYEDSSEEEDHIKIQKKHGRRLTTLAGQIFKK